MSDVTPHQVQEFLTAYQPQPAARCLEWQPHKKWKPEDLQQLKDLRQNPLLGWSDIAIAMNRSISGVKSRYLRNKRDAAEPWITKDRREYSEEEDATLIRMYNEGAKPSEIQRHLPGRSTASVKNRRMVVRHLIQRYPSQHTRAEQNRLAAQIAAMRNSGKTWAEISQLLPERTARHMRYLLSRWQSQKREDEKQGSGNVEGGTEREDTQL